MKLTQEELSLFREIRIHRIMGIVDNGRRIALQCPFHKDKTPSFTLYPDNSFYCFGCKAKGNGSIDFCVQLGYSFSEALEELTKYI